MAETAFRHSDTGTEEQVWRHDLRRARIVHVGDLAVGRAVVVAPHPDDESLGAGGLVASWSAAGVEVTVVVCTDGEASHGDGAEDRGRLAARRRDEVRSAVDALSTGATVELVQLGLPDGGLCHHEGQLQAALRPLVAAAEVVVSPWPGDGHPDHEAVGRCVRDLSGDRIRLEYPVWAWHWGRPEDLDDARVVAVPLSPSARRTKAEAIACHLSQQEGDDPIVSTAVRAHFERPEEHFLVDERSLSRLVPLPRSSSEFFEALYRAAPSGDPWDLATSHAEQERYDAVAEALGAERFERALEVGCATGELTRRLAHRVGHLLAIDAATSAVAVARRVVQDLAPTGGGQRADVELRVGRVPECLDDGDRDFDLIVLSEVGYYFDVPGLGSLVDDLAARSTPGCTLVAAHWTGSSPDHALDAGTVHEVTAATLRWHHVTERVVGAHRIDVWRRP